MREQEDRKNGRLIPAEVEERLLFALDTARIETLVAHTYGAIRNLSGGWYSFNYSDFQAGGDHQYLPWLVVDRNRPGEPLYLCSDLERSEAVLAGHPIAEIAHAEYGAGFTKAQAADALARALAERGLNRGRLGLELGFLPAPVLEVLRTSLPHAEIVDAQPLLLYVRAVKTAAEIELLRGAAAGVEDALRTVFAIAGEGVTDVALEHTALSAIAAAGGTPVQRYYLLGIGPGRQRHGAGNPISQALGPGDVLLVDLGAKVKGMHGDLVRVGVVGDKPSFPVHDAVALAVAATGEIATLLRPGMSQREAFVLARQIVASHAEEVAPWGKPLVLHHGLGWSLYEPPFDLSWHGSEDMGDEPDGPIDAYGILEEGMVFSLETAVISPDGSEMYCNMEDPYVLTKGGCDRLNTMRPDVIPCGVEVAR